MTTREKLFLTKQQALDILLQMKHEENDFEIVEDDWEQYKNRELHFLVIKRKSDGKFFGDQYEIEEGSYPWDDHAPDFHEVFAVETKTIEYK